VHITVCCNERAREMRQGASGSKDWEDRFRGGPGSRECFVNGGLQRPVFAVTRIKRDAPVGYESRGDK
jgi:hypothetical protein